MLRDFCPARSTMTMRTLSQLRQRATKPIGWPYTIACPKRRDIGAGLTLTLRRRRLENEKIGDRSSENVAVEVIHQVPPNRSVRMVSGACPRLVRARETVSTNPVGPQI